MIKGRQPGDNITLMNTMFFRRMDPKDEKFKEFLALIYKDADTGIKYIEEKVDPDYEYYMINPDKRVDYNRLFVSADDVEAVQVPYKELEKDIAKRVGCLDYFYENIKNGNRTENRKIHQHPDVFNSDMNIEDHYRFRFDKMYKNDTVPITKSFFDIEVDSINMVGDFPEPGECPVNAITLILQEQQQVYTFLLRNKANPLIAEFENSVLDGSIFPELEAFVVNAVGGPEMAAKYNINFKYNFLFYDEDDEINLIKDLFNALNNFKPDFVLAWNMGFDVPYLIARCQKLGYAPEDIMCHPDFKNKIAQYFVDERMKSEFAERGDFALISSYSVFLDQMIQFASRRKGQSRFISFTLDFIGEAVAKVRKLDYKHITTNIAELPYKDYKTFVFYNIIDTIVQHCIECMTGDIDYVFGKSLLNNTRYSKTHRQTVYLTNRGCKEFRKEGFIIGNNVNKFNPPPTEKFPGAYVADPTKLDNTSRLTIFGRFVDLFNNLDDFDYASLYPSILRQFNIAAHTQIGKLLLPNKVHDKENPANRDDWSRAGAFMEDMQSQVWLEVASRWFSLADYTKLYFEVIEFFREMAVALNGVQKYTKDGLIIPMIDVIDITKNRLYEPMIFNDSRRVIDERYVAYDIQRWEAWRNAAITNPNQHY